MNRRSLLGFLFAAPFAAAAAPMEPEEFTADVRMIGVSTIAPLEVDALTLGFLAYVDALYEDVCKATGVCERMLKS